MFTNITVTELIPLMENKQMTLIDVRSPVEFENFSIPTSINIPFFTNEERAEIGTIYTQISETAARDRGLEIISAKLPDFIKKFKAINGEKTVFCWRGGMRSRTTATLLDLMNIHVHRLDGGIRAYRKWVIEQLENIQLPPIAYVLSGLTGTGKTKILQTLQKEGYPVIDLEGMANHKGSIFGHIGQRPNNQKTFDALLVHRLRELQHAPFIMFESESSRVGKVTLPHFLLDLKGKSNFLMIELPIEERINEILEEYRPWDNQSECLAAFLKIKSRIHTPVANQIEQDLKSENYKQAVRLLLEYYYDKRYKQIEPQYPDSEKIIIHVKNIDEAIQVVKHVIPRKGSDQIIL
ncbi:tRNA 2-selenouridine(34) synthase MnmH [Caldibacillus thermoamylovorans]|uniref:Rhodanese domain-containing protein n=1 Tax=Caldibacillus thermoamylovorans TaxID=35841 RepID=A0ABD4A8P7_9BACI|nr:tRNA 2-selenouridine(34) synthase MnmH [Caldibacillus thermoamylovorans]KIO70617.1 hypothetical protein B4166_1540 [Caldibacillus thermoamylovorans]KIO73168.1 hypothetical protein B4167_2360 [Caldibacillus thermoamylovorans]